MIRPVGPSPVTALVVGATGLVGRECVRQLAAQGASQGIARTIALVRRVPPAGTFPPTVDVVALDFALLGQASAGLGATHVVCALGTTMKQAGSREAFRRVDHDYVLAVARGALAGGARHFVLVSALGADAASSFFYNRVKGETEQAILALGYRAVTILRPSLLLGPRGEFRLGEAIAKRFAWLTPAAYKPVQARDVAAAAVRAVVEDRAGTRILESRELRRGTHVTTT
jgi:uncharacterized protein YbjT (DUF2867 family)